MTMAPKRRGRPAAREVRDEIPADMVREPARLPREELVQRRRRKASADTHAGKRMPTNHEFLDFNSFAYRYINDETGGLRIFQMTKRDDWDIMSQTGGIISESAPDSAIYHVVGTNKDGSQMRAYLCRKPKKYYDEDQAAKAEDLDEQLAQLRLGNDRNGKPQADYVPSGGISIPR